MAIFGNLDTGSGGGDFLPLVIYDARAGRLFKVERSLESGQWVSVRVEITQEKPAFIFDFGSIEAGWVNFAPQGPGWSVVPYGRPIPERPSKDHRQTIRAKIFSPRHLDGVREFSATAKCVLAAIDELHDRFEAAPEAAAGKVPVVKLTGTTPVTTKGTQGTSTNYAPVFEIVQWADRPAELGERTVPPPKPSVFPPKSSLTSGHVPPPRGARQQIADDPVPF